MTYEPRGGALALFRCRDREIVYVGPAGTGKTRAVLEKLFLACMKYPRMRAAIVRKTRASLTESAMVTFENKVCDPNQLVAQGVRRQFRHSYLFKNGSEIVLGGMANMAESTKVMSTEYDIILTIESTELSEDDIEKLKTRLRNGVMPYQQLIAECNPSGPGHWLKRRIDTGKATEILSRHTDNPSLTQEYLNSLAGLTGHRRSRLFLGQWAAAEGLVYDGWDRNKHLIDAMPTGWEAWPKYRCIDFGFTNPFVCQWWAVNGDGEAYLYRELYRSGVTIDNHAKRINELSAGEKYEYSVSDHDSGEREFLAHQGIDTIAAIKDVTTGIQTVADRLRVKANGRPSLFILRSALVERDPALTERGKPQGLAEEIENYMWHPSKDGKADKEEPIKEHDHACDACRYLMVSLAQPQVPYLIVLDDPVAREEEIWQ